MNSLKALKNGFDICVLGEPASGKSSLILYYLHQTFIQSDRSIEDLYTKVIINGPIYNEITILDTSSLSDTYSKSRRTQISNTETILFVYAIDNFDSFQSIEDVWQRLKSFNNNLPPIVIIGTKCDLESQRQVSYDEGVKMARTLGAIHFAECSAKLGVGINEAFQPLVATVLKSRNRECATAPVAFNGGVGNVSQERRQSIKSIKSMKSIKSVKSIISTKSINSPKSIQSAKSVSGNSPESQNTKRSPTSVQLKSIDKSRSIQTKEVPESKSSSGCCTIT